MTVSPVSLIAAKPDAVPRCKAALLGKGFFRGVTADARFKTGQGAAAEVVRE